MFLSILIQIGIEPCYQDAFVNIMLSIIDYYRPKKIVV